MGIDLPAKSLFPYTRPDSLSSSEIDGEFGMIGTAIEAKNLWWLGCYLLWRKNTLKAVVSLWVKDTGAAKAVYAALQRETALVRFDKKEIMLVQDLQADQLAELSDILRGLVDEWSQIWKRVGSLKRFYPDIGT